MPTILRIFGLRFFFFSNEGSEPPHIHVEKDDSYAFSTKDLNQIRKLVEEHQDLFLNKWHEFFSK